MKYLLDTNVLIHIIRYSSDAQKWINQYNLLDDNVDLFLSIVSQGEIESIALQNKWGIKKLNELNDILNDLIILDIRVQSIIDTYAKIDAYSQGRLPSLKGNFSARNMGKNDIWIAATASYFDIPLITTDKDFEHLNEIYIELINP